MKQTHTYRFLLSLFRSLPLLSSICLFLFGSQIALAGYDVATRSFGPFSQLSASVEPSIPTKQVLMAHDVFITPWQSVPEFHSLYIVWSHTEAYSSADDLMFLVEQEDGTISHLDFASDGKSLADASVAVGSFHASKSQKYRIIVQNKTGAPVVFPTFEITTIKSSSALSADSRPTLLGKIAYTGKQITDMILSAPQEMSAGSDMSFVQSRASWWADESLRTVEGYTKERDRYCQANPTASSCLPAPVVPPTPAKKPTINYREKYPEEFLLRQTVKVENGKALFWPLQYAQKIRRLYVHHTAQTADIDEAEMIRNDYYFHTIIRQWGDIGYNFLIGPSGKIYQWRAGDPTVVGAHVVSFNEGSIGIALLGHFTDSLPTKEAVQSLARLTNYLAGRYNLALKDKSSFRGVNDYNLLGHRDSGFTQCPGDKLYALLPAIRQGQAEALKVLGEAQAQQTTASSSSLSPSTSTPQFTDSQKKKIFYGVEMISPLAVDLDFGKPLSFTLRVKNNGPTTWLKDQTNVQLRADNNENIKALAEDQNAFNLLEDVKTGQIARFTVSLKEVYRRGVQTAHFDLVLNGQRIEDALITTVRVNDDAVSYQVVGVTFPTTDEFLVPGTEPIVSVAIKNTSPVTWTRDLVVLRPWTKKQDTFSKNWTQGTLQESSVSPWDIGHFLVPFKVVSAPGTYQDYYNLWYDGAYEFKDQYYFIGYRVASGEWKGKFLKQSEHPKMRFGESTTLWSEWRNDGKSDWIGANMNMRDDAGRVWKLKQDRVEPWQIGTFETAFSAPYDAQTVQSNAFLWYFGSKTDRFVTHKIVVRSTKVALEFIPEADVQYDAANNWYFVQIRIRNNGESTVPTRFVIENREKLDVVKKTLGTDIPPGQSGVYYLKLRSKNGADMCGKNLYFDAFVENKQQNKDPIVLPVVCPKKTAEIKVEQPVTAVLPTQIQAEKLSSPFRPEMLSQRIRVRLSFTGTVVRLSASGIVISVAGQPVKQTTKTWEIRVSGKNLFVNDQPVSGPVSFSGGSFQTLWTVVNWNHAPWWNPNINDNVYRDSLEIREENGQLYIINELPLPYYLNGVAEAANTDPIEKIKAVLTAARTYALYYMYRDQKFPWKPYHLDDTPSASQNYRGYSFEQRYTNGVKANEASDGFVVVYKQKLIKTPFFTQSDGTTTKSAESVWGWKDTPYLVSVSDSSCTPDGKQFRGHGVGLSGCGAYGLAQQKKTFREILAHYYVGTNTVLFDSKMVR